MTGKGDLGPMSALEEKRRDLEVLQALYAHWARGDFDFAEPYADDVIFVPDPADLDHGEFNGRAAMAEQWRTFLQAWKDFRIKALDVIPAPEGRYVVVQAFRGIGKASGAVTEETSAAVMTLRDGEITRMEGYWDRNDALRAAGLAS
jgi:ketosteroid isomerase-like protein